VVTVQLFFIQLLHGHTACTPLRPSREGGCHGLGLWSGAQEAPAHGVPGAAPLGEPRLAARTP
jgi:hypothetical protein